MSRVLGPGGVGLGAVVIAVGAILQASGAEAAVFCSVIGAGIVLAVLGAVAWIVHFVRERKAPRSPLAA